MRAQSQERSERLKLFQSIITDTGGEFSAADAIVLGGVLDRFPNIRLILSHLGGGTHYLMERIILAGNRGKMKDPVRDYFRRFYYDTIGYSDPVLEYLVRVIGADRVLMGSDYCFPIAYEQPVRIVTANPALDEPARRAILSGNARALLRLDQTS